MFYFGLTTIYFTECICKVYDDLLWKLLKQFKNYNTIFPLILYIFNIIISKGFMDARELAIIW